MQVACFDGRHGFDNIQIQVLILMYGDVPKSDHPLHTRAELRRNQPTALQQRKALSGLCRHSELLFPDDHACEVDGRFAGASDVEYCSVLTCEVLLEGVSSLRIFRTRTLNASKYRRDFPRRYTHDRSTSGSSMYAASISALRGLKSA